VERQDGTHLGVVRIAATSAKSGIDVFEVPNTARRRVRVHDSG
jgi:hypothetical protein